MVVKFYRSQVISNQVLNYKFRCLRFKLQDKDFTFQAGQFIIIKIQDKVFRDYSISTPPRELPFWETVVDISPGGPGSRFFNKLKPGDQIKFMGPSGIFTLREDNVAHLLLVATGSGISSIKSMTEQLLIRKSLPHIYFFWGLRFKKDIFYRQLLKTWRKAAPHFQHEIVLSQPEANWKGKTGHVTGHVAQLAQTFPSKKTSAYLCGNRAMITDVTQALKQQGLPQDRIYFEEYYKDDSSPH